MVFHRPLGKNEMTTLAYPVASIKRPLFPFERTGDWRQVRPVRIASIAPCTGGCPAGIDIRGWIEMVRDGRFEEAWRIIKADNPFPAITGRVCYHPCEDKCSRGSFDEPVSVRSMERFVGDYALAHNLRVAPGQKTGYRFAVVGSGPAGLSAAYQIAVRGHLVSVFERNALAGGMLRIGIPAYRLPKNILDAEIEGLRATGIDFVTGHSVSEPAGWDKLREFDAVFLAPGCQVNMELKVPGCELRGVVDGLSFLRDMAAGNSSLSGKQVLVIGGGNVAIDAARCAARMGAKQVQLTCLEALDKMPASAEERQEAVAEGISIMPSRSVVRIVGRDGQATGVECIQIRGFAFGPSREAITDQIAGSEHLIEANVVVTCIGLKADPAFLPPDLSAATTSLVSGVPVLFGKAWVLSGGDWATGPTKVVDAFASGKRSAQQLHDLVTGQKSQRGGRKADFDPATVHSVYFARRKREEAATLSPDTRLRGFEEIRSTFNEAAAMSEASRCFHCGECNLCGNCWIFCPDWAMNYPLEPGKSLTEQGTEPLQMEVNYEVCKGCGICAHECPRGALTMEDEPK